MRSLAISLSPTRVRSPEKALGKAPPHGKLIRTCKKGDLTPSHFKPLGILDDLVMWSKCRDSSNQIVFTVKNEHFYPQWSRLMSKTQTLGKRYRLDLPWVVKNMRRREDPDG